MAKYYKSTEQGTIHSRTINRLANTWTLVQRLGQRSLTGQCWHRSTPEFWIQCAFGVWNSHGYGAFGVWNGDGGARKMGCFERCFLTCGDLSEFCVGLEMGGGGS